MRRVMVGLALGLVLLGMARTAVAGGWAVVTLDELPLEVRAGQSVSLGFMVRQHGRTPINDVTPYLLGTNSASGEQVRVTARQDGAVGHFVVDVTFPATGTWEWEIVPEPFGGTRMAPLTVLPAAPVASPATSPAPIGAPAINPIQLLGGALLALAGAIALFSRRGKAVVRKGEAL